MHQQSPSVEPTLAALCEEYGIIVSHKPLGIGVNYTGTIGKLDSTNGRIIVSEDCTTAQLFNMEQDVENPVAVWDAALHGDGTPLVVTNNRNKPQEESEERSRHLIDKATAFDMFDHEYAIKKDIEPIGGLLYKNEIVLPVQHVSDNSITGVQRIDKNGNKQFYKGTKKKGAAVHIGEIDNTDTPLVIVEGWATGCTVHQATNFPVLAALDAGNLNSVANAAYKRWPKRRIVIAGDNDHQNNYNPGQTKATEAAKAIDAALVLPEFSPDDRGTDWNDYAETHNLEAVQAKIVEAVNLIPTKPPLFSSAGELIKNKKPIDWLIRDICQQNTLFSLIGPPASGKSLLAISLGACVATGRKWLGRPVESGTVAIIAGEGHGGISQRLEALKIDQALKLDSSPLFISHRAIGMLDTSEMDDLISELDTLPGSIRMIIVDTLARSLIGGSENSNDDMGSFVHECDRLRYRYGCSVLVVHHPGYGNKSRSRGGSALPAAVDTEFVLSVERDDTRILTCTKQKDAEPPSDMAFRLKQIDLGFEDDEGEPVTSVVLEPTEAPSNKPRPSGKWQNEIADILFDLDFSGAADTTDDRIIHFLVERHPDTPANKVRESAKRAISAMESKGIISRNENGQIETKG